MREIHAQKEQIGESVARNVEQAASLVNTGIGRAWRLVEKAHFTEHLATPEHRKTSAGDAAKHLQEARIARTVDANRPRDHDVEAAGAAVVRGEQLRVELGALIDVPGRERRVLVCRRRLDVAVDAAGAAVDDTPDAGGARRFEYRRGRRCVPP